MPYVTLTTVEESSITSKKGKLIQGMLYEGVVPVSKYNKEEKDWKKFVPEFDDALTEMFAPFKPGDSINVKCEKNGDFWDIVDVQPLMETKKRMEKAAKASRPMVVSPVKAESLAVAATITASMMNAKVFKSKEEAETYMFLLADKVAVQLGSVPEPIQSDTSALKNTPEQSADTDYDDIPF